MALTIGLLGDVMLGRGVAETLHRVAPEQPWSPPLRELVAGECDVVLANLECCVSQRGHRTHRIVGKPFFFRAPPAAAAALQAIGVGAVGLANNHALDYEEEALADTLDHLDAAGIAHAGAGRGAQAARRPVVVEAGGRRVALVAVSDHPPEYAAGEGTWGIAFAGLRKGLPEWLRQQLAAARAAADLVVAFPHWGPNMTPEPAGWQRDRARELVEGGADIVAGHSAHVFHGVARVQGRLVLYDLGDALDDYAVDPRLRNDLGVLALWRPGGKPELELVGLALDYCLTRIAEGPDADWIAARLERACQELGAAVQRTAEARFALVG
jgi:poly-gamma-glutamate capsule biosynthesis protein CapA/YwtB (metallophosphatase superfamily)